MPHYETSKSAANPKLKNQRLLRDKRQGQRHGQVLILFLGLTAIGLLLAISALSLQGAVYHNTKRASDIKAATYLAEAGIEKGFLTFQGNSSYTGETLSLGDGSVTVTLTNGASANEKYVIAQATVNGFSRQLRAKLVTSSNSVAVAFSYAMQAGSRGFVMGNGSQINGNVYSNQNVTGGNGSLITGDAYAVGTVSGVTVNGQKRTSQPAQALPTFNASFWKTKAQEGGTITGNYTPTNGSIIGPLYVTGNLTITNGIRLTVRGPVYVSGSIIFGNGPIIQADNSLGSESSMLVTEQKVTLGNSITLNNNTRGGYLLIATTSSATDAINIGNSSDNINGPLYAPNGTISIGNNAHAVAFTGAGITTGNNTILTYDEGLASTSFSTGPGGGWTLQKGSLQEYQ